MYKVLMRELNIFFQHQTSGSHASKNSYFILSQLNYCVFGLIELIIFLQAKQIELIGYRTKIS